MPVRTAVLAIVAALASTAAAQELGVSLQPGPGHPVSQNIRGWQACLEDADGALTTTLFPAAQLYRDAETAAAVGAGDVALGAVSFKRLKRRAPSVGALSAPFLLSTREDLRAAFAEGSAFRALAEREIEAAHDVKVLWWLPYTRAVLVSKTPAARPDALRDQRLRVTGKAGLEFAAALGAQPVVMSRGKQFLAYQQGAVDAGVTTLDEVSAFRLFDVAPYLTLLFSHVEGYAVVMNHDLHAAAPDAEKALIARCAAAAGAEMLDDLFSRETALLAGLPPEARVVEPFADEQALWREATAPVIGALRETITDALDALAADTAQGQ